VVVAILVAGVSSGVSVSYNAGHDIQKDLHVVDNVVLGIFVVELSLKMFAASDRPARFLEGDNGKWNLFDLIVVGQCRLAVANPALKVTMVSALATIIHKLLSAFVFYFNLRRYVVVIVAFVPSRVGGLATVIRLCRLLRLLKLIRAIPQLQVILGSLMQGMVGTDA
jgi:voltage-gated sodium channel